MECKTDLGRKETTSEQQVTNSTIIITRYENLFLVSSSVITKNYKEYSKILFEWSAQKCFIVIA